MPEDIQIILEAISVDAIASSLWHRDYPDGGSIYKTYESTQFHDKELYRNEAKTLIAAAPQKEKTNDE